MTGDGVFLHPGEWVVCDGGERIHTLLGSCVAVTVFDAATGVGGMCHFVLPHRGMAPAVDLSARPDGLLSGKFGDEAIELLVRSLRVRGIPLQRCECKLFGGSNVLSTSSGRAMSDVGERNIDSAITQLDDRDAAIAVAHVGEAGHRRLIFLSGEGAVLVKHVSTSQSDQTMSGAV